MPFRRFQPEQYKQIAATDARVLIVQGAAGSGKSLIGLHRIDFILSPFSDIGSLTRPTAERVIMFGPSPAFLEYVSGLLPGLGIRGVRQTTVTQWLLDQFSSRVTLSTRDKTFADLMNNRRKPTDSEIEAHLFKSGVTMRRLLDKYVGHLKREILRRIKGDSGIVVGGSRGTFPVQLSAGALRRRVADALKNHAEPNVARTYLANSLAAEWMRLNPRGGTARFEAIAEATRLVESSLSPIWPRIDFRTEYVNLVSSPEKIMAYARKGDVDSSGAAEITRTAPSGAGQALGLTDLAAALYLDYSINGFDSERFEHVFVDEAQDVSPLEIILMQMHSTNNSFSIMGDLRQSVLRYKSISNWNQLAGLFKREGVSRLDSRLTYRSTKQITQYANRLLQGLPERTRMPVPHDRSGPPPKLVRSRSVVGMHRAIAESVRRLLGLTDIHRVAVLTKWQETADKIGNALRDEGIKSVRLLTQDGLVEAEVTVSPILLTKGLEFDAVIVANARKDNFYESEFDRLRHPRDKPRVERGVPYVRERFFKGGEFTGLSDMRSAARRWCLEVAGQRVHGTTRRQPLTVFRDEERHALGEWDAEPYEMTDWRTAKVHPDHHIACQYALYSVPSATCPPGQKVEVRLGSKLVRIYHRGRLIKVHPRQDRGGRSTDPDDYPAELSAYTLRAPEQIKRSAASQGPAVAAYAERLFDGPLPWAKLRQGHKLIRLCKGRSNNGPARRSRALRSGA